MSTSNIPDIGARHLMAVLAVAENRSFIAAAAALRTSQPALTRSIKRVEGILGVKLFERTTRQVRVTEAGHEFIAVAQRMANDLRITVRNMRDLAEQQRGQVIVASITSIANSILPDIVTAYHREFPGVEIHIRDGVHGTVNEHVGSGAADFGINYLQDISDTFTTRNLGRDAFVLVASKDHFLAADKSKKIGLADLQDIPLVSLGPDSQTRRILDAAAIAARVSLTHKVVVSQVPTMLNFIRANAGVGFAPAASVTGNGGSDLICLKLKSTKLKLKIGVIRLRDRHLTPAATGLQKVIEDNWPSD